MARNNIPVKPPVEKDKTQGVQNAWLLIISLALGVIVVFVYNIHINRVRKEAMSSKIRVAVLVKDVGKGDRITRKDVQDKLVPEEVAASDDIVKWSNIDRFFGRDKDKRLAVKDLHINSHLQWSDIEGGREPNVGMANKLDPGESIMTVTLDKEQCPGMALRIGNMIKLTATVPQGTATETITVLKGVQVVTLGGKNSGPVKSYDNLGIIVQQDCEDVLRDIEQSLLKGFGVVVLPSGASYDPFPRGKKRELEDLKKKLAGLRAVKSSRPGSRFQKK